MCTQYISSAERPGSDVSHRVPVHVATGDNDNEIQPRRDDDEDEDDGVNATITTWRRNETSKRKWII